MNTRTKKKILTSRRRSRVVIFLGEGQHQDAPLFLLNAHFYVVFNMVLNRARVSEFAIGSAFYGTNTHTGSV